VIRARGNARSVRLRSQLAAITGARLVINTGHRMIYPFLPTFARGLGVSLDTVALAVTARSALGLIGPLFGMGVDRLGRKAAMIAGVLLVAGGMALVFAWPTYPALVIALLLASAGKLIYDPAMQAYIGDRVQYAQRGLAIAVTELGWSGAFLLGMPVIGWLIARSDRWQAPFPLLAGLGVAAAVILWRIVPHDGVLPVERPSLAQGIRLALTHPSVWAALLISLLISASNEVIGIVYGAWLEDSFGLKVTALGASAIVIGIAELAGEGGVAGFVDRLGKRRAVTLGISANALACLMLPALGVGVEGALIGLFLVYLTFEFAVVSAIPLMTELVPSARVTVMAGNLTAFSAGRMLGTLIGPPLFDLGLGANGVTAAIFDLVALAVLLVFVQQE
jgi:predicted MFS family arabinose efflux permease